MTPLERDHERGLNGALAAEIRAELAVQDRSQTWLAERTDMDRVTLRRYLKAERALNTAVTEIIATALHIDAGELMTRAVQRRNRYPELYGPDTAAGSSRTGAEREVQREADAAVDAIDEATRRTRPTQTRTERQQRDDRAARDDTVG